MPDTYGIGCKDIQIGDIGIGGTMGSTLASVGKIYKDTVNLIEDESNVTNHFQENARYPFLNVIDAGPTRLKFTLIDVSADNLAEWLGGEAATDVWSSPTSNFSQEKSVEVQTVKGWNIQVARCMLYGKITWNLSRTEIAKIEITGEIMVPEDASTPPIKTLPAA
jgi:hypothetical protein